MGVMLLRRGTVSVRVGVSILGSGGFKFRIISRFTASEREWGIGGRE